MQSIILEGPSRPLCHAGARSEASCPICITTQPHICQTHLLGAGPSASDGSSDCSMLLVSPTFSCCTSSGNCTAVARAFLPWAEGGLATPKSCRHPGTLKAHGPLPDCHLWRQLHAFRILLADFCLLAMTGSPKAVRRQACSSLAHTLPACSRHAPHLQICHFVGLRAATPWHKEFMQTSLLKLVKFLLHLHSIVSIRAQHVTDELDDICLCMIHTAVEHARELQPRSSLAPSAEVSHDPSRWLQQHAFAPPKNSISAQHAKAARLPWPG